MSELKIMTFNLRVKAECDGINILDNRKGRIINTVKSESPDLIGFQEVADDTRAFLRDNLEEYCHVGCGRYPGCKGEGAPLAFKKDKFEMVSSETFWLSTTPNVPGSKYSGSDQSDCPRVATAVKLCTENGRMFLFINTHTDHMGKVARAMASAQILEYVAKQGLPFILTGDLNAEPDSVEIKMLTASPYIKAVDATAYVGPTFHAFGQRPPEEQTKIDYVITDLPCRAESSYAVEDVPVDGIYISDHRPVVAFVEA